MPAPQMIDVRVEAVGEHLSFVMMAMAALMIPAIRGQAVSTRQLLVASVMRTVIVRITLYARGLRPVMRRISAWLAPRSIAMTEISAPMTAVTRRQDVSR